MTTAVKATTPAAVKPVAKAVTKAVAKKTTAASSRPVAKAIATKQAMPKKPATATKTSTGAKPAVKAALKVAPKVATRTPVKAEPMASMALAAKPKLEKLLKAKKPKLVRDSFTIPKIEYLMLEELKLRSGKLGNAVKKSELIRAGIKALVALSDVNFLAALKAVPAIKTGRPAKD